MGVLHNNYGSDSIFTRTVIVQSLGSKASQYGFSNCLFTVGSYAQYGSDVSQEL